MESASRIKGVKMGLVVDVQPVRASGSGLRGRGLNQSNAESRSAGVGRVLQEDLHRRQRGVKPTSAICAVDFGRFVQSTSKNDKRPGIPGLSNSRKTCPRNCPVNAP